MSERTTAAAPRLGVNVTGFLRAGLGLGEAARLYVAALSEAGVPVRTTAIGATLPPVEGESGRQPVGQTTEFEDLQTDADTPFNLVCVNAPELPQFHERLGPDFFDRKRTIGVWAWEVDGVPGEWAHSFDLVHEIWVYSSYVEGILRSATAKPIVRMPLPIVAREPRPAANPASPSSSCSTSSAPCSGRTPSA